MSGSREATRIGKSCHAKLQTAPKSRRLAGRILRLLVIVDQMNTTGYSGYQPRQIDYITERLLSNSLVCLHLFGTIELITQTAEYALRAVVYLADQQEPTTNNLIAESTLVPVGYLAKVMQSLSRAGLVTARRGLHGGFELAVPPDELTVLQVVNAVEPIRRFKICPLGLHGIHLCPLHRKLDDVAKAIEETFGDATIADMINAPKNRKPLCSFPASGKSA